MVKCINWNKQELERLYWQEEKNLKEIASLYQTTKANVYRGMKRLDIALRSKSEGWLLSRKKYPYRSNWDKEELDSLYWKEGKSIAEIAQIFNCCSLTIRKAMRMFAIPTRSQNETMLLRLRKVSKWNSFTKELLETLYWGEGKSSEDIAKIYNCNGSTVSKAMKNLGIPLRSIEERKVASFIQHPMKKGPDSPYWMGRRKTSEGYIIVYKPDHPYAHRDGYVFEHRIVIEEKLGRYLLPSEYIHHLNGIKDDNRVENLELLSPRSHKIKERVCAHCPLRQEIRLLRWEIKQLREAQQLKLGEEL